LIDQYFECSFCIKGIDPHIKDIAPKFFFFFYPVIVVFVWLQIICKSWTFLDGLLHNWVDQWNQDGVCV